MSLLKSRIFLVGCPRSGTTLLQSLLAAHPQIASVPETHFFKHLSFKGEIWNSTLGSLGFISRRGRRRLRDLLHNINREDEKKYFPKFGVLKSQYIQSFIRALDDFAEEQDKSVWVEKTPGHLRYIDYITRVVPDVKFIHILRKGEDVVASLYEATNRYPEQWGRALNIDECISQWNRSIQISERYIHSSNHILVRYESLVSKPTSVLETLCIFIGIEFVKDMLSAHKVVAKNLVLESEPWKTSVYNSISNSGSNKFTTLFSEDQRSHIRNALLKDRLDWLGD